MFLVANAVSISVLRRRPEIATLRSIGTSRAMVFGVFLLEGLASGASGRRRGGGRRASFPGGPSGRRAHGDRRLPADGEDRRRRDSPDRALLAAAVGLLAAAGGGGPAGGRGDPRRAGAGAAGGSIEAPATRPARAARRGGSSAAAAAAAAAAAPAVDGFPVVRVRGRRARRGGARAVSPLARAREPDRALVGPLVRLFGAPGRLAAASSAARSRATAISVTALAMALGMTLAMIVTVSSIRETVRVWVESTLRSDLWVKSPAGRGNGIVGDLPEDVVAFLRSIPGVAAVDPFRARDQVDAQGRPYTLASGDFRVVGAARRASRSSTVAIRAPSRRARAPAARRSSRSRTRAVSASAPATRSRSRTPLGTPALLRSPASTATTRTTAARSLLDRALYLALFDDRRVTSAAVLAAPGVGRGGSAAADPAAAHGPLRPFDLDQPRAAPRGAPHLRPDLRRHARARGDRRRRRRPRDRQRARRVRDRAAPVVRPAPRDRRVPRRRSGGPCSSRRA